MSAPTQPFNLNHSIFHDIAAWLCVHPPAPADLYSAAHTVQAIFRALPPLARQYVMSLVFLPAGTPVPLKGYASSLRRRQRAVDRHDAAVRSLFSLRILHEPGVFDSATATDHNNNSNSYNPNSRAMDEDEHAYGSLASIATATLPEVLVLHQGFAAQLRGALALDVPPALGGPLDESEAPAADMESFSARCLETILNFLVESSARRRPSEGLLPALQAARILEARSDGLNITSEGFHFLLKPSFPQLWVLLRALLVSQYAAHYADALHLLFELSAASPGRCYTTKRLSHAQIDLLTELHELGIVMLDDNAARHDHQNQSYGNNNSSSTTFRPTAVGVRLLTAGCHVGNDVSAADLPNIARTSGEMHVFVETNFRVYAYTFSEFQTNLLGLFTHLRFKLPGMVVAHITRTAVREALVNGITAEQIIAYLNAHAHPRMKKGVIPPNVSDEIRLWEAEQHRIKPRSGVLLGDFQSDSAFERVLEFANGTDGGLLWHNVHRKQLFVSDEQYDAVKQFIQRNGLQ